MSRAQEASNRAAAFIVAQEEGGWSEADQASLDAWLAEEDGNKAAYWRLKHSWREADRIGALGRGVIEEEEPRPKRRWWVPASIAASLVALVGAGYLVTTDQPDSAPAAPTVAYKTPVGGGKLVGLSDGSRIQLNTASVIRTSVTADRREVWLDKGEAYFEVRHLDSQPFIVHAGNRQVTVLGTKFSVRRDGDRVTVSVLEGRVRVDEIAGAKEVRSSIITGGDIAIARGDATLVTAKSEDRVEDALSWRTGTLTFDQTSLSEIAAEFNRYNTKPLVVADSAAASMRIGGSFPANKPGEFVQLLRDAYGLKVTESATEIKISN
jgi:transmembrane sensor